jgi:hypothetical protein
LTTFDSSVAVVGAPPVTGPGFPAILGNHPVQRLQRQAHDHGIRLDARACNLSHAQGDFKNIQRHCFIAAEFGGDPPQAPVSHSVQTRSPDLPAAS